MENTPFALYWKYSAKKVLFLGKYYNICRQEMMGKQVDNDDK